MRSLAGRRRHAAAGLALLATVVALALPSVADAGVSTFALAPGITPEGIAKGSDGALWFGEITAPSATAVNTGQLGRITTAGALSQLGPLQGLPVDIVSGPDGALWFAEANNIDGGGALGRIQPGGAISEYGLGSLIPQSVAAGPDGAMWVTQNPDGGVGAGSIARITTAGVTTNEFGPFDGGLADLGAGPDGAVWFSRPTGLERITPAGVHTTFKLPQGKFRTDGPLAGRPVAGPDGALWFSFGLDTVGRLTTAGQATAFTLPPSPTETPSVYRGPTPSGLTLGPDGALWFVLAGSNRLAPITTAGAITEYGGLPPGFPTGAPTFGPDGALWLSHSDLQHNGTIVRLTTDTPPIASKAAPPSQSAAVCRKHRKKGRHAPTKCPAAKPRRHKGH
ncbi:MAG: hypothetical protein NVS3B18_12330 [Candidatus Dormibacteria bacterium]